MEESGEAHSADDKGSSGKIKRRFKTPQQLVGLEEFYDDHKYPTEEMRLQLAEQLGLTEKQISGWFCHRRLKDKRLLRDEANADGRQDRASGVNQDRVSGLRQDSCGSTKQADRRLFDPREVESRRLHRPNSSSADLTFELKGQYDGNFAAPDDTSSGSSSASRDRFYNQGTEHYDRAGFVNQNEVFNPNPGIGKSTMDVKYKPSGYLKRKGEVENAALTAVKKQLGRHYRDDGPLLGIHFDPLPPGAFESPIDETDFGSHYADDPTMTSPHGYGVRQQHNLDSRFSSYNSKVDYHGSYEEEGNFGGEHNFRYQMHNPSNKKYGSSNLLGEFCDRKSSDTPEFHNGDMYIYNSERERRSTTTGDPAEEMRQEFASDRLPPRSIKNAGRKKDRYVHEYGTANNGFVQNEKMKFDHVTHHYSESLHPEEGPSRKISKKEKQQRDRVSLGYLDYKREKMHPMQDIPIATGVRAKSMQQDGTSFSLPPRNYQTTVSSTGVPSYMEEKDEESNSSEE